MPKQPKPKKEVSLPLREFLYLDIDRVQDFAAYFRLVRSQLEATALQDPDAIAAANYPEPVEHCEVCRWWSTCDKRRRLQSG